MVRKCLKMLQNGSKYPSRSIKVLKVPKMAKKVLKGPKMAKKVLKGPERS